MTEQREKNAYFEYLVMPRLKKLFSLCKEAGVDGYLTMGADESIGINVSLEQGEVFISYKAYNADFDKLLKLRQNACDMVLTLKYAAESVTDDRELLAPEETVQDADDLKAVLSAYESGIWLGKKDLNYDRERLKEIIPLLLERDLKLTDNSDDGKKPHIMIPIVPATTTAPVKTVTIISTILAIPSLLLHHSELSTPVVQSPSSIGATFSPGSITDGSSES